MALQEEKYMCTDIAAIPRMVSECRDNFLSMSPTPLSYRITQIKGILRFIEECEDELIDACRHYYGGSKMTHFIGRLWIVKYDCYEALKNLSEWTKPISKPQPFPLNLMWSASIEKEAYGVCSIIAPWNYPINLLLRPLIGAIAAGNAVIVKPSEVTDRVARVFASKLPRYVDNKMIKVVVGGAAETSCLLQQRLNFVLFTGGGSIGKIVMNACAKQLTPCCLELGGKNPVIIDDDADLETSIKRVLFGRFNFNGGQICVAPEYVFISRSRQAEAISIMRKYLLEWYGKDGNSEASDAYFHVVSNRHFNRLQKVRKHYLENEADKIAIGACDDAQFGEAKVNAANRHLPPMVLCDVDFEKDYVMKEEVFGPILSLIPMDGAFTEWKDSAVRHIQTNDTPLAAYIFSRDKKTVKELSLKISAGTVCVNDTVMFLALRNVPFGGCGESGMGRYAGKYSFDTFSHEKPIATRSHGTEFLNKDRYPNYDRDVADLEAKLKREAKTRKMYEGLLPKEASKFKRMVKYWAVLMAIGGFAYFYQRHLQANK